MHFIPILQPLPLVTDPLEPLGTPQLIIQVKELEIDKVRYQEWKEWCSKMQKREEEAVKNSENNRNKK